MFFLFYSIFFFFFVIFVHYSLKWIRIWGAHTHTFDNDVLLFLSRSESNVSNMRRTTNNEQNHQPNRTHLHTFIADINWKFSSFCVDDVLGFRVLVSCISIVHFSLKLNIVWFLIGTLYIYLLNIRNMCLAFCEDKKFERNYENEQIWNWRKQKCVCSIV